MQTSIKEQNSIKSGFLLILLLGIALYLISQACLASPIIIAGNKIINTPTMYNNVELDMTNGRFTITAGGSLTIENAVINVAISPSNPYFVSMNNDSLSLKNNTIHVTSSGITPNPNVKSLNELIDVQQGKVEIVGNTVQIDNAFTVGFLTTQNLTTDGFIINNNTIKNFHGGVYLVHSNNAHVNDNTFENVSFANIYILGNLNKFKRNIFSFPGNLMFGDAIDVVSSDSVTISDNIIASDAGYGISIMGGQNIFIDNNKITDGSSYAIFIHAPALSSLKSHKYLSQLVGKEKITGAGNTNIVITNNYLAQNRYGLAGKMIDKLIVTNNTFIQRFTDSSIRQFWTNNDILLPSATNLTWSNNIYKEAFTQEVPGDNKSALRFVVFPEHGGVFLP